METKRFISSADSRLRTGVHPGPESIENNGVLNLPLVVRIQHEHTGGTQIDGHILAIALRLALLAHRIEAVADDAEAGLRIEVLDVRDERTPLGAVGKRDECAVLVRTLDRKSVV